MIKLSDSFGKKSKQSKGTVIFPLLILFITKSDENTDNDVEDSGLDGEK